MTLICCGCRCRRRRGSRSCCLPAWCFAKHSAAAPNPSHSCPPARPVPACTRSGSSAWSPASQPPACRHHTCWSACAPPLRRSLAQHPAWQRPAPVPFSRRSRWLLRPLAAAVEARRKSGAAPPWRLRGLREAARARRCTTARRLGWLGCCRRRPPPQQQSGAWAAARPRSTAACPPQPPRPRQQRQRQRCSPTRLRLWQQPLGRLRRPRARCALLGQIGAGIGAASGTRWMVYVAHHLSIRCACFGFPEPLPL